MFTVYILYSEKFDKTYVGFTSDLEKRFLSHNELATKGWTIKFRPWKIIHSEIYDSKGLGNDVYYYALQAGDKKLMKKMTVVK